MKVRALTTEKNWRRDGKGADVSQLPPVSSSGYLLKRPERNVDAAIREHLEALELDEADDAAVLQLHADIARGRRATQALLTGSEAAWLGRRLRELGGDVDGPARPLDALAPQRRVTQRVEGRAMAKRPRLVPTRLLMSDPARFRAIR